MNCNDPWDWSDWTSPLGDRTPRLIGLEDLEPEPCDGTGDDEMSMRVRNKWHRRIFAERQAAEDAAFAEWLLNQNHDPQYAQHLGAMWQQREELDRRDKLPKETLVDVLNFIARVELDGWSTISRKFSESIQCALPLRRVSYVSLTYFRKDISSSRIPELARLSGLFRATFTFDGQRDRKTFLEPDVVSISAPFFGCLRFCSINSAIYLQNIPIDRAFLDNLKAIKKDFHTEAGFYTCELFRVTFAEDVDPYDVVTSLPLFRRISTPTLGSLIKHFGSADDALLSSLAAHGVWSVWIPGDKRKEIGWSEVVPTADVYRITEDGVLDYAFGDYDDDEEGRCLKISSEVPLTPQFFEKLVQACRGCKRTHKTEVCIATHRAFNVAEWNPKEIRRDNDHHRRQYAHRPVWEFHVDDLPALTVRYVAPDPQDDYRPGANIHFWLNVAPTSGDRLLVTGPRY